MPEWLPGVLLVLGAYLLGAAPFGYLVARVAGKIDIRTKGSGNIGATNVGRVLGRKWGILVFVLDVVKGFAPAFSALILHNLSYGRTNLPLPVVLAGLAAIVGHNWPVYLKFRGGKGVATSCGVFGALFPLGLAIALGVWILAAAATRYVSVGSMLAGIALLVAAFLLQDEPVGNGKYLTLFAGLAAVLSILRHRANIGRLLRGTENKIGRSKNARE